MIVILLLFGSFLVKFLKGKMFYCVNFDKIFTNKIITNLDCYDYGGDWVFYYN